MLIRVAAATIAGAIVNFFGGWVIWGILLKSYFDGTMNATAKAMMRPDQNFVPLILAQIVFAFLFVFIFDRWASIRTFAGGAKAGAILSVLIGLGFDLQMSAFFVEMHNDSSLMPLIVDLLAGAVMGAIAGGVMGAVLGMMNKQASAAE